MRSVVAATLLAAVAVGAIVVVEHSVQSGNMFSHRAELSLQASRAKLPVTVGATEPLTPAQVKYMIDLAKRDELYRVRVTGGGLPTTPMASVRACQLAAAGLRTELQLILSQRSLAAAQDAVSELAASNDEEDTGAAALLSPEVVGVDVVVPMSAVGCAQTAEGRGKQMEAALTALWAAQKSKSLHSAIVGPVLPLRAKVLLPGSVEMLPNTLQARGQPPPGMGKATTVGPGGEEAAQEDAPKSFWQQYGGYITPILVVYAVMTLFGGAGGGAGGGEGGGAGTSDSGASGGGASGSS